MEMSQQQAAKEQQRFAAALRGELAALAQSTGWQSGGFVPEVTAAGCNYTLTWLKDERFAERFSEPADLYYNISRLCFYGGVYFAHTWQADQRAFRPTELYWQLFSNGAENVAGPLLPRDAAAAEELCSAAFDQLMADLAPYLSLGDYRPYLFAGLCACFDLGASLLLPAAPLQ